MHNERKGEDFMAENVFSQFSNLFSLNNNIVSPFFSNLLRVKTFRENTHIKKGDTVL